MFTKYFDDIDKTDIDMLIENAVIESRTLEYKECLPGNSDGDTKEFLADVSAFANASGGYIIYGISEKADTKEPELKPLQNIIADEAKLRLENKISMGISPRLRVYMKEISGWGEDGKGFVLLIHIPKSLASPHMVTHKNTSKFYSRHSSGKCQLDVQQIRSAFLATESQATRIKRFRQERLSKIIADETPILLYPPDRLVLHVVPLAAFLNSDRLDLISSSDLWKFKPVGMNGGNNRINVDGHLTWYSSDEPRIGRSGYCQLFFDGTVESVRTVFSGRCCQDASEARCFSAQVLEDDIIDAVADYFAGYSLLGVSGPIAVFVTLLHCSGTYLATGSFLDNDYHPIDRDVLMLPDIVMDDLDADIPKALKPIFDSVWNACGYPGSQNYDKDGNWKPRR